MENFRSDIFQYLGPLAWKEVFTMWKENDLKQANVEGYYRNKGFSSWEEWTRSYAVPLKCAEADWHFYNVFRPEKNIPNFYGGPFKEWTDNFYKGKDIVKFSDLVKIPAIKNNPMIRKLADNFPKETLLIGLIVDGEIIILEGMHRCCAMALINKKRDVISGKVSIALFEYPEDKLPSIG